MIQGMSIEFCVHSTLITFASFADYSTIFNGNVVTMAKAVVCPLDAEDVSKYYARFLTRNIVNSDFAAAG